MMHREAAQLKRDARKVFEDIERFVDDASHAGQARADAAAAGLCERLDTTRDRLVGLEERAVVRARGAGRQARTYARHHPWSAGSIALAVVAAGAIAIGLLARRRRS